MMHSARRRATGCRRSPAVRAAAAHMRPAAAGLAAQVGNQLVASAGFNSDTLQVRLPACARQHAVAACATATLSRRPRRLALAPDELSARARLPAPRRPCTQALAQCPVSEIASACATTLAEQQGTRAAAVASAAAGVNVTAGAGSAPANAAAVSGAGALLVSAGWAAALLVGAALMA